MSATSSASARSVFSKQLSQCEQNQWHNRLDLVRRRRSPWKSPQPSPRGAVQQQRKFTVTFANKRPSIARCRIGNALCLDNQLCPTAKNDMEHVAKVIDNTVVETRLLHATALHMNLNAAAKYSLQLGNQVCADSIHYIHNRIDGILQPETTSTAAISMILKIRQCIAMAYAAAPLSTICVGSATNAWRTRYLK